MFVVVTFKPEKAFAEELDRLIEYIEEGTDASTGLSVFAGLNRVEYEKAEAGRRVEATHIREGKLVTEEMRSDDHTPEELAAMLDPRLIGNNLPGPGLQYMGAWFHLRDDEAILIEGRHVPCRYWCCQILTRYMESGDYRYQPVSLNDRQVKRADDGRFRIYACPTNPGVENWFSTQGYQNGHILLRALLPAELVISETCVARPPSLIFPTSSATANSPGRSSSNWMTTMTTATAIVTASRMPIRQITAAAAPLRPNPISEPTPLLPAPLAYRFSCCLAWQRFWHDAERQR